MRICATGQTRRGTLASYTRSWKIENLELSKPLLGFIVSTRAALAFGVGLLVADRIPPARRHAIARAIEDQTGRVIVPKNSPAQLTVAKYNNPTLGQEEVSLALHSINIGGQTYQIATNAVTEKGGDGIGANKKTAEYVGGGALLGTLIGAVAGGGKGAAIGAAVGGAGGGATQVLTKGKEVKVPAESVLTFQLDQPLRLQR